MIRSVSVSSDCMIHAILNDTVHLILVHADPLNATC